MININEISNDSFQYEERMKSLWDKCSDKINPSVSMDSNLIRQDKMLNYLGFVLRSHSLFYCSVPKVATRTLLPYITYLHIRDELITAFTNNSTLNFNANLSLFNVDYISQMISSSIKVNI